MIRIPYDILKDINKSLFKEWYVTNFCGDFISSSILLCNTRRYHGLLNVSRDSVYNRLHTISALDDELLIDGISYKLSVHRYSGLFNPEGFHYLESFEFDLLPRFNYRVNDVFINKEIFMVPFKKEAVITYKLLNPFCHEIELYLHPYFSIRNIHDLGHDESGVLESPKINKSELKIESRRFNHPIRVISTAGKWHRGFKDLKNIVLPVEKTRGDDFTETLFSPAYLSFNSDKPDIDFAIRFSLEPFSDFQPYKEKQNFLSRKNKFISKAGVVREFDRLLVSDAMNFLAYKNDSSGGKVPTIIAGYPWFEDWGRDTMISLPGILLETNHLEEAREILIHFSNHIKNGLVPNYFSGVSKPVYNTVDASLWYFIAIWRYLEKTGDLKEVRDLFLDSLSEIFKRYFKGTDFGIKCDKKDFLITQGKPGYQLTWMDAKVGDRVITPRRGKPIEVQGLWYNAIRVLIELTTDNSWKEKLEENAETVLKSIRKKFWIEDLGILCDVIDSEGNPDISLRPNAVIAVALPFPILEKEDQDKFMRKVTAQLLTPFGLRSLDPDHNDYLGYYEGDRLMRDQAYHQGTVWSWLMGPYISGLLRYNRDNKQVVDFCNQILKNYRAHLNDAGLGSVSEIFDGEYPHRSRGCFAQAWGVGELIRTRKELIKTIKGELK